MRSASVGLRALIGLAWIGLLVCGLMTVWTGWLLVRAAWGAVAGDPTATPTHWLTVVFLFVPSIFGLGISRMLLRMVRQQIPR